MLIKNHQNLEQNTNPHGIISHKLYNTENAEVIHLYLKAGESLKPHITPVDVFFYVLEGTPTILVGEERIVVKKDNLIESPKEIVHCISNESKENVRVLVVKVPRPTSKTILVEK